MGKERRVTSVRSAGLSKPLLFFRAQYDEKLPVILAVKDVPERENRFYFPARVFGEFLGDFVSITSPMNVDSDQFHKP